MIRIKNLYKKFGTNSVFENVSLNISTGSKVALIGTNGSGKSTLIKLLVGLIKPDKGDIQILDSAPSRLAKNTVGILLAEPFYIEQFSVLEYLKFVCEFQKISKETAQFRIDKLTFWLQLNDLSKRIKSLSTGNQMKVSIISALINDPKILLLDEPFRSLDDDATRTIIDYLRETTKSFLITAHSLEVVGDFCDRFIIIGKKSEVKIFDNRKEALHHIEISKGTKKLSPLF